MVKYYYKMECKFINIKFIGVRGVIMKQNIVFHLMEISKGVRNAKAHFIVLEEMRFIQNKDTGDKIT